MFYPFLELQEQLDVLSVFAKQTKAGMGQPSRMFAYIANPMLWGTVSTACDWLREVENKVKGIPNAVSGVDPMVLQKAIEIALGGVDPTFLRCHL